MKSESKKITKKKTKPTKAEKEKDQYKAGAKQKFIDTVIRKCGSVSEITDPYGR